MLKKMFLIFILNMAVLVYGQNLDALHINQKMPENYVCYQTEEKIICDGLLNESSWAKANWTNSFSDIEGKKNKLPYYETKVKILYDHDFLYIASVLEDQHIWSYLSKRDDFLYFENNFEVFIDPNSNGRNYFEIEVNAQNTLFDLFLDKPYKQAGIALLDWDLKGLKSGVKVNGTLNNARDLDKNWTVEIAIPFSKLNLTYKSFEKLTHKVWRINFARVQWETIWENGKYVKKTDPVSKLPLPEQYWVWTDQAELDMHKPEKWGYLQFANSKVGADSILFKIPYSEKLKNILWSLFDLEKAYFLKNAKYTNQLCDLGINTSIFCINGLDNNLSIQTNLLEFELKIICESKNLVFTLKQNAELLNLSKNE